MDAKKQLDNIAKMLKDGGFKLLDVQFEGGIEATDNRVVAVINKMAESQQAMGVFRIYYEIDKDNPPQVIEIPVGPVPEEAAPEEGQ